MTEKKNDSAMRRDMREEKKKDGVATQVKEQETISRSDYGLRVTGSPEFVGQILET